MRRDSGGPNAAQDLNQGALRLALEQREQDVVAPGAVDLEIGAGEPFALEAVALEQRDRRRIVGNAGRLDAMQPQRREAEVDRRGDGARHAALAGVRRAHPIAERRRSARRRAGCRRASGRRAVRRRSRRRSGRRRLSSRGDVLRLRGAGGGETRRASDRRRGQVGSHGVRKARLCSRSRAQAR